MPIRLLIDTEFTDLQRPQLLSLGAVAQSESGQVVRECYVQRDATTAHAQKLRRQSNRFVQQHVWPILERHLGLSASSEQELAQPLVAMLRDVLAMQEGSVEVAYDYHADYDFFESLLQRFEPTGKLLSRLEPTPVAYLLGDEDAQAAMARSWQASLLQDGLPRHHALADARALAAAFHAVHDQP